MSIRILTLAVGAGLLLAAGSLQGAAPSPTRWQKTMDQFKAADAKAMPAAEGVLFIGSSSIRLWDLEKSFPGKGYINRGFGGSYIADSTHYADDIVFPYRPTTIVMFAGGNDLAGDLPPDVVADDFRKFANKVHSKLPKTRIIFIAVKASQSRWAIRDRIQACNKEVKAFCDQDERLVFVDAFDAMLGEDGLPRAELLREDKLHLSDAGYELWTSLVKPHLPADDKQSAVEGPADLILHNGKVAVVDQAFTLAQAIAVRDGRILQVGANADVLALRGEKTEVIDLQGRLAMPGLIDSHTHPGSASMHEFDHPVPDMETVADVLDYIRQRAAAVGEGEWVQVSQIFITRLREQRYPTRAELDAAAPKNPVVFSTGPDASVNSMALELSGIDRDFRTTGSGEIERDPETGEPTGILRGNTKRYLKTTSAPGKKPTTADREERLKLLFADYNAVGITCIADRNASDTAIQNYDALRRRGELTLRIACSHALSTSESVPEIQAKLKEIAAHPLCRGDNMLRIVGVKAFQDGGMLTGSAYMTKPWGVSKIYSIVDPRYQGVLFIEKDKLLEIVRTTIDANLQFTAHSVGDGAVRNLLDVYETIAKDREIQSVRPCITHCNFMSENDVQRMADLGVVADIQPAWLYLDGKTLRDQFGEERLRWFQPLKSLFEAGAIAGGGSDHMQKIGSLRSINPYNPFLGMWISQVREPRRMEGKLHPEESLSREQAIRFYTQNNAYIVFLDEQIGSLEAGKQADLIVVDRDLLTCPVDDIKDAQVDYTFLGGKRVFARNKP
ncbi:amidohydrolase family protein [Lignipirellula cremea]|uniref:N-substituted formamide deformylase n=1 Tax=Lignipirellula cremea TaxID=2528010 RepID=A0A518E192_9BACT|nr:amidohydrolase family protein [Lignipirellula cremea]QDU97842.1 N-substituted formamide deformylase precursor [Lignipirellula cremea]